MKRKFLCLLLALTMVLGLAATVSAYPNVYESLDEEGSNDTLWDAQPIELGETYGGQAVAYNGDSDLFTFTLTEKTQIRISMAAGDIAMDLALFDSKGKLLTTGEHLGFWPNDYSSLQGSRELFNIFPMELDPGTYHVGIWSTDGSNHAYWFVVNRGVFPCGGYHRAFVHEFIVPSTCQSEGVWTSTCLCGNVATETAPAIPDMHTFETEIVTPSSCTENGFAIHTCTGCGYIEEETLWAEHTAPGKLVIQDPTMDDYGLYYFTCADCGFVDEYESHLYPLDHTFIDVQPGQFYEAPVCWAVYKNITSGTSPYHFSPATQCNRAQAVTFLWSAAGKPEPTATEHPFVDVPEGCFFEKAVLWAVEMGITAGTDETHFSPAAICNRATIVTFLYKALGSPDVSTAENPFKDIPDESWYTAPVLWAKEMGITSGTDATHFTPAAICNRAQMVTFLYSAYNK